MIYAFTGKTGSGKTFHMVAMAYQYWRDGVDIFSNTILNFEPSLWDNFYDRYLVRFGFKPKQYGRIRYFENISEILEVHDGLILFDEAQVLFNARLWESLPDEFSYKLQQHRKHRLDLFCTTQNMGTIDINYRRLVQVWFHHSRIFGIGNLKLGVFRYQIKDIDMLYNNVDDLAVPDIGTATFWIGSWLFWRRTLYDTFYDVGFKRFKAIWQSIYLPAKNQFQARWWIVPKKMSLKDAQREFSSQKSSFFPSRSANFKRS